MKIKKKISISDYQPYPFEIPNIYLDFSIYENYVQVISLMTITPTNTSIKPLTLKGIDIELNEIYIDNIILNPKYYDLNNGELTIKSIPDKKFELKISSKINPFINTSLEGLYLSSNILTTQCEAEGFRRIAFHPDRPDILSRFKVRIEADLKKYPIILSNGNNTFFKALSDNPSRHSAIWEDPFPKPSYLFALVAGDLINIKSSYKTISQRNVSINLFVEKGDEIYTNHAIKSIKKAMKWDEDVYGLEYDLDLYNIVAIRHFNMGAMENKGLNIFNSKLILADSKITTDEELERIESVIAHEYFHNWTGNRITCRDWFQLSLKEGLTVFRDQSFTSDLHSAALKRIQDVSLLRNLQFKEDAGPTAHPVKPNEYLAIDNFYTTTIYEKGAELIRMLYILLGHSGFMEGIKSYISTFDGTAATTEDFVYSLTNGAIDSGIKINFDVEQFIRWYYQSGTPSISIKREWDQKNSKLKLIIKQSGNYLKGNIDKKTLVIPIRLSLLLDENRTNETLLILDKEKQEFEFDNLFNQQKVPVISLFRDFSAPVTWSSDLSIDELLFLIKNDDDLFSLWDAVQSLFRRVIISRASNSPEFKLEESLLNLLQEKIKIFSNSNKAFLASILTVPNVSELELYQHKINPIALYESSLNFSKKIASSLFPDLLGLIDKCLYEASYKWPDGQGSRKLISVIWKLLILTDNFDIRTDVIKAVKGDCMTLSRAALQSLIPINCPERETAMNIFYSRWKNNPVVLDTWFALQASIPREKSLENMNNLLAHKRFDPMAPNSIRAVLGGFSQNIKYFHSEDGSGYLFMAKQIILVDKRNPITASRLTKVFNRWQSYTNPFSSEMYNAIKLMDLEDLSSNTREVVDLTIK